MNSSTMKCRGGRDQRLAEIVARKLCPDTFMTGQLGWEVLRLLRERRLSMMRMLLREMKRKQGMIVVTVMR